MLAFLATAVVIAQGLDDDSRLAKPIAITEYAVPAPQVCADLAKLSGVPITCDASLSQDLVVLLVRRRPAKEVMTQLADTFGWKWQKSEGGYQLQPTPAFVRAARDGRNQILAAEGHELQAKARTDLASEQSMIADLLAGKLDRFDNVGVDRLAEHLSEAMLLTQFIDLDDRTLVRMADHRMVFAANPGPLEVPLSNAALKLHRELIAQLKKSQDDPERLGHGLELPGPIPLRMEPGEISNALLIHAGFLSVPYAYLNDQGKGILWSYWFQESWPRKDFDASSLPNRYREAFGQLRDKDIASLPPPTSANPSEPLTTFAHWLAAGAQKFDLDLVADAYDGEFDIFKYGQEYAATEYIKQFVSPSADHGWLTNRIRKWPRYREEQIPRALLRYFNQEAPFKNLDQRAKMASTLTMAQLTSPLRPFQTDEYFAYRLWDFMPPRTRRDLVNGATIPTSRLPSTVLEIVNEEGNRIGKPRTGFSLQEAFNEAEFCDHLKQETPFQMFQRGGLRQPTFTPVPVDLGAIFPTHLDVGAKMWIQSATIPCIYDSQSGSLSAPGLLARFPNSLDDRITLAPTRAIRIHIELQKDAEMVFDLTESTLGRTLKPDHSDWPPDLLSRIAKWDEYKKQDDQWPAKQK